MGIGRVASNEMKWPRIANTEVWRSQKTAMNINALQPERMPCSPIKTRLSVALTDRRCDPVGSGTIVLDEVLILSGTG